MEPVRLAEKNTARQFSATPATLNLLVAAPMAIQHTFNRIFKSHAFLGLTVSVSGAHLGIRL
jgi:hypothetical protein